MERRRDKERDLPSTVSLFPNGLNGQGWAKAKLRTRSSVQVSQMGPGGNRCCTSAVGWIRSGTTGTATHPF